MRDAASGDAGSGSGSGVASVATAGMVCTNVATTSSGAASSSGSSGPLADNNRLLADLTATLPRLPAGLLKTMHAFVARVCPLADAAEAAPELTYTHGESVPNSAVDLFSVGLGSVLIFLHTMKGNSAKANVDLAALVTKLWNDYFGAVAEARGNGTTVEDVRKELVLNKGSTWHAVGEPGGGSTAMALVIKYDPAGTAVQFVGPRSTAPPTPGSESMRGGSHITKESLPGVVAFLDKGDRDGGSVENRALAALLRAGVVVTFDDKNVAGAVVAGVETVEPMITAFSAFALADVEVKMSRRGITGPTNFDVAGAPGLSMRVGTDHLVFELKGCRKAFCVVSLFCKMYGAAWSMHNQQDGTWLGITRFFTLEKSGERAAAAPRAMHPRLTPPLLPSPLLSLCALQVTPEVR